jgi:two-component system, sporulation sensor kinase B
MNDINYLLLQILIVILPIFIYQTLFGEKLVFQNKKKVKMYEFSFLVLALLLSMSLPNFLTTEYRFDLRLIPIMQGFLYGGPAAGWVLTAISLLYRVYLGGFSGVHHYVVVLVLYIPIILFVSKFYKTAARKKRISIFILLSLCPFICSWIALAVLGNLTFLINSFNSNLIIHITVVATASWLIVSLLEGIRENMQMRVELQHAEKMNMLRDLTSVFAHEIRNPMQVTRGFLQLLHTSNLSEEKKNYIQISLDELDSANEIINEFLSLAKPTDNKTQVVEIGNQLTRVLNILQGYAANNNVQFQTNLSENCSVIANPQKFNQCLINMIKNAIEAMPYGGVVTISCYQNQHRTVIEIEDQGIGMTKEQIARIGTPFYSLKEKGTGIGLMVSYQIIHSCQGKIKVTSEKDVGTKFSILFPAH